MTDNKTKQILEEHEKQHANPAGCWTCLVIIVVFAIGFWIWFSLKAIPEPVKSDHDAVNGHTATASLAMEEVIRKELSKLDLSSLREDYEVSYDADTGSVEFTCVGASIYIEIITYSIFLSNFVEVGQAVFSVPGVKRLRFVAKIYVIDGYNNISLEEVIRLRIAKKDFESNEWDGLTSREMLPILERSCDEYFVHEWLTRHFQEDGQDKP